MKINIFKLFCFGCFLTKFFYHFQKLNKKERFKYDEKKLNCRVKFLLKR